MKIEVGNTSPIRLRLQTTHRGFESEISDLLDWLKDAENIFNETQGIIGDRDKNEKMFLIMDSACILAISAFEYFIKTIERLNGDKNTKNVNNYGEVEKILKESWRLELNEIIGEKWKHMDLLFRFRHIIVHCGNIPDEKFLKFMHSTFGPEKANKWHHNTPVWLDPINTRTLIENLKSCEESIMERIHNQIIQNERQENNCEPEIVVQAFFNRFYL